MGLGAPVQNVPILVRFNAATHADLLNNEATQAQPDGSDIRVTLPDGVTDVPFEIEHLTLGENGVLHMWILAANVAQNSGSAAQFRVYWGKDGETSMSNGAAVFSPSFGYQAVFHLNEPAGNVTDVVHGYEGVATGTVVTAGTSSGLGFVSPKSGPVVRRFGNSAGGTDNETEATHFIQFQPGPTDALSTHTGPMTFTAWVYSSIVNTGNESPGTKHIIAHDGGNMGGTAWFARTAALDGNGGQNHYSAGGPNTIEGPAAPFGEQHHWQFVAAVYDDGAWTIYRQRENDPWNNPTVPGPTGMLPDSVLYKTYAAPAPTTSPGPWFLGAARDTGEAGMMSRGWHGWMDEVRISTVARDSNYVKLSFFTMRGDSIGTRPLTIGETDNPAAAGPYASWSNRRNIVLNTTETGANVAEDVVNFPVLVRLGGNEQSIIDAANGGNSIRFTKADDMTILPYEIEHWGSNSAAIWVLVDTVYGNNSTQRIRMHWGNASATDESNSAAVFDSTNGFLAAWHLGNAAGTNPRPNAAGSGNPATPQNFPAEYTAVPGIIGMADTLRGGNNTTGDRLFLGSGFNNWGGSLTMSMWVKPQINDDTFYQFLSLSNGQAQDVIWMGRGGCCGSENRFVGENFNGGTSGNWRIDDEPNRIVNGQWQLLGYTIANGNQATLYYNGQAVATSTSGQSLKDTTLTVNYIARSPWPDPTLVGVVDEVRISNVTRSAAWMKLSYENQKAMNTLTNIGQPFFTVPGQPTGVTATPGNAQATISWTAPTSDGGQPITEYKVMVVGDTLVFCTSATTSCDLTSLVNGENYTVVVRASNSVGAGPNSAASAVFSPIADPPGAPTAVTGFGGNNSVTVSWTAPANTGGAPISQYKAMVANDTTKSCSTAALSCTIAELVNGQNYTVVVRATNMAGPGPLSEPSAAITAEPPVVPGAPTGVTAANHPTIGTSINVTWVAPADNGRSPITGYTVTGTPGGSCTTTGALTCTVSGLAPVTSYTFTVVATNAVGNSAPSAASAAVETPASLLPGSFVIRMDGVNPYAYQIHPAMARVTDRLTMTIHDIYGRRVWSHSIMPSTSGVTELTWNGRTSTGMMAAAGMYIVRIDAQLKDGTLRETRKGTNLTR